MQPINQASGNKWNLLMIGANFLAQVEFAFIYSKFMKVHITEIEIENNGKLLDLIQAPMGFKN